MTVADTAMNAVAGGIAHLLDLAPAPPDEWYRAVQGVDDAWSFVIDRAAALAPAVPFATASTCLVVFSMVVAVGFGIELVRIVLSYVTGGGGST